MDEDNNGDDEDIYYTDNEDKPVMTFALMRKKRDEKSNRLNGDMNIYLKINARLRIQKPFFHI